MRSDRGGSAGRNGTQRTDSTVNARVPMLIGACLPTNCDFCFLWALLVSYSPLAGSRPRSTPSPREIIQIILATSLARRLANDLHALALRTKHSIHERLPFFGSEALEAGRHDAQARTARLDGRGLERR